MNSLHLSIPAKALLFGEYGVLYGGKAIAVTFFSNYFHISIKIQKIANDESISIKSDFFPNKLIQFSQNHLSNDFMYKNDANVFFFVNLLKPWKELLKPYKLEIHIEKSYSPSLGFGSSSALIAGISRGLWQLIYQNEEYLNHPLFWKNIRDSIKNIQGKGSGYDVAVQLAASQSNQLDKNLNLWIFQNKKGSEIPTIEKITHNKNISDYGCFLSTNIYSDTTKAIKKFQNEKNKLIYAKQHSDLADWFLINHSLEHLKIGMERSLKIAKEQGIIPINNEKFNKLLSILNSQNVPYKTMGAGHGDCLWILTNKKKLTMECHIPEADIPFAFETYGTES
jgi:mevalonate kinase